MRQSSESHPGFIFISSMVFMLLLACHAFAFDQWPDTGQTTPAYSQSYDTFGKDGDYTVNPPSYTKLGYGGIELDDAATVADGWIMTKDNVTGLIWEVKTDDGGTNDKSATYTWCDKDYGTGFDYDSGECTPYQNIESFIDALNTGLGFGGYTDWRMPTVEELLSITNLQGDGTEPYIDTAYFPNTQAYHYWSATTYATDVYQAWTVEFGVSYNFHADKAQMIGQSSANYFYARAVRGGTSGTSGLVDNKDGTVTDTATGLTWQQTGPTEKMTLTQALEYCESLDLAGYTDWRLPNRNELLSLVDFSTASPCIDTDYFPDTQNGSYWSSSIYKSTNDNSNGGYWQINFSTGGMDPDDNWFEFYARAVRSDGAQPLPSTPVISIYVYGKELTIYWDAVGNIDGYRLYYAPYPGAENIYSIDLDKNKTYVSYDLASGMQFYLALKAYNGAGESDFSNIEIGIIP